MVNQRFNRLLSRPDPILKPYGSVEISVDVDREGSLPPSLIDRYILKRAAGFTRVCFQSHCAVGQGQPDHILMHNFFREDISSSLILLVNPRMVAIMRVSTS
ncbi:g433 [Coccomyxa elongata]